MSDLRVAHSADMDRNGIVSAEEIVEALAHRRQRLAALKPFAAATSEAMSEIDALEKLQPGTHVFPKAHEKVVHQALARESPRPLRVRAAPLPISAGVTVDHLRRALELLRDTHAKSASRGQRARLAQQIGALEKDLAALEPRTALEKLNALRGKAPEQIEPIELVQAEEALAKEALPLQGELASIEADVIERVVMAPGEDPVLARARLLCLQKLHLSVAQKAALDEALSREADTGTLQMVQPR